MERHHEPGTAPGGFTLLEVVLICLMVGTLAAIGVPRLMPGRLLPEQGAQVVASTFMQAQRLAVSEQRNVILSFDLENGTARIVVDADHSGAHEQGERFLMVELGEGIAFGAGAATPRSGETPPATFETDADGYPTVTFHRNGSASESGAIYLTAVRATAADTRLVALERSTGKAEVLRPDSGSWVPLRRR